MIGPILMGTTLIVMGLTGYAISITLARWGANWHWTLRDEQKPAYASRNRQTLRIGAICFMALGGALIIMGLLTALVTGRWVWSSLAV